MRLSPDNAVECVARRSVPSREEKPARRGLFLAVEPLEQRDKLITEREHSVGRETAVQLCDIVLGRDEHGAAPVGDLACPFRPCRHCHRELKREERLARASVAGQHRDLSRRDETRDQPFARWGLFAGQGLGVDDLQRRERRVVSRMPALPVRADAIGKGIYGIGDVSSAVEGIFQDPREIILRSDHLSEAKTPVAALQMITGGLRHGMFTRTMEERLRRAIHWEMLRRRGLNWLPPDGPRWWSEDAQQRARNRQIYHGLRLSSLAVINGLIGEALQAAAEPNALALARRFRFHQRYAIYRATAASHRALQITDVFPTLGLAIFGLGSDRAKVNLIPEAKRLVEGGAPLRKIAELMGVPTAFRRVKPGAAHLALAVVDAFEDPRLIDAHMPEPLTKMKLWLMHLPRARRGAGFCSVDFTTCD